MPPAKGPPRMTANPVKAPRYRPGKAVAEEVASSSEEEGEDDSEDGEKEDRQVSASAASKPAPPKVSSFPSGAKTAAHLKNLDLNARRQQELAREKALKDEERKERERMEREAGFITESEEGESDEDSDEEEESIAVHRGQAAAVTKRKQEQEESESSDEGSSGSEEEDSDSDSSVDAPKMLRPMFIKKAQRNPSSAAAQVASVADAEAEAEARAQKEAARKQKDANALIQERIEAEAAMKEAQKRDWDDEGTGELDDTDGLEPELEHAEWVARELGRLKRARAVLEEHEAEIAETERRRNLTTPEREAEDNSKIAEQQEAKEGKGKAGFMARYHHRGAFFGDAEDKEGRRLAERDLMGARFEGESDMAKEALPKYLQVRDQTMIGRKGRQRHRDLRGEDTGKWGDFGRDGRGGGGGDRSRKDGTGSSFVEDERFMPDRPGDIHGATGANASAVRERKRPSSYDREEDSKRTRVEGGSAG